RAYVVHVTLPPFPTRRSSDLVLDLQVYSGPQSLVPFTQSKSYPWGEFVMIICLLRLSRGLHLFKQVNFGELRMIIILSIFQASLDRKSTRLNSSHVSISYAVF